MHDVYLDIGVFIDESQNTIFTSASTTANTSATQNPLIWKPGTIWATRSTMRTLMMSEKSQRVMILSGRVRIWSTGVIVTFTIARTTATITAVKYPSMTTPGVRYAAMATAIPESMRLRSTVIGGELEKLE